MVEQMSLLELFPKRLISHDKKSHKKSHTTNLSGMAAF